MSRNRGPAGEQNGGPIRRRGTFSSRCTAVAAVLRVAFYSNRPYALHLHRHCTAAAAADNKSFTVPFEFRNNTFQNRAAMDDFLNKKYKLSSSENFDQYMKALGVGMLTRQLGNTVSPVVELTKSDDGKYTLSSNSAFKNTSITFKLGEEFDEVTPDGRKVKSTVTQEGNKLLHTQKSDKLVTTILREFEPDQLKMVLKVDDITCTRVYKPIQ
ncbi:Lipocalin/cytosolic fatty-acid binding domain,Cytosolic fatty-acid binding,Calycin [Cinara cedri]|uniref:Fatty acid-binding protein, muscle n=1 Tax=Cinara cedri TaxID=506608 RepID=A0A5E4M881_9HEMI|nr:Lipocalin/cytosolic fatty-acid binding domain,Cytosolic fatty-acid binding,Calycin [Cinara cedri]